MWIILIWIFIAVIYYYATKGNRLMKKKEEGDAYIGYCSNWLEKNFDCMFGDIGEYSCKEFFRHLEWGFNSILTCFSKDNKKNWLYSQRDEISKDLLIQLKNLKQKAKLLTEITDKDLLKCAEETILKERNQYYYTKTDDGKIWIDSQIDEQSKDFLNSARILVDRLKEVSQSIDY